MEASESILASLLQYVRDRNRVCPQPTFWNEFYDLLMAGSGTTEARPSPVPNMAVFWDTPNLSKLVRFKEHIDFASASGSLQSADQFLRSLAEDDWHHFTD